MSLLRPPDAARASLAGRCAQAARDLTIFRLWNRPACFSDPSDQRALGHVHAQTQPTGERTVFVSGRLQGWDINEAGKKWSHSLLSLTIPMSASENSRQVNRVRLSAELLYVMPHLRRRLHVDPQRKETEHGQDDIDSGRRPTHTHPPADGMLWRCCNRLREFACCGR